MARVVHTWSESVSHEWSWCIGCVWSHDMQCVSVCALHVTLSVWYMYIVDMIQWVCMWYHHLHFIMLLTSCHHHVITTSHSHDVTHHQYSVYHVVLTHWCSTYIHHSLSTSYNTHYSVYCIILLALHVILLTHSLCTHCMSCAQCNMSYHWYMHTHRYVTYHQIQPYRVTPYPVVARIYRIPVSSLYSTVHG